MIRVPLLLLGIVLSAYGGLELYHAARNRDQAAMTCEDLVRAQPPARWIRATGCEIDYMGATWRETRGQIREMFFPVQPSGHSPAEPIAIVAATTDPEVLAVAQGSVGDGRRADPETFTVMGLRMVTILKASREIEGYARHGLVDRALARRALTALGSSLAPEFVVVDLHARPPIAFPAVVTAAGAAALLGFVVAGRRRRPVPVSTEPVPAVEPPAAEVPSPVRGVAAAPIATAESPPVPPIEKPRPAVVPEPVPVASMPHGEAPSKLPAMMLLNLPASAGVEAIEHAPALGSRADVMERIARTLPGIHFDASGRATWDGRDWSLAIALGQHEPVWTVTVEARGSAAMEAAHRLATHTGWRIYVPKRGAFVLDEHTVEH